ncbi:MAG TPA: PAS domain-containing protein [Bryobacteraceae bacterium]|nr:PAS domain-containing protein [Bryobacteraceae bacterium]
MTAAKAQALAAFLGGEEAGQSHAFREIVEILPVAVYVTDAIGRLTYFNDAARELSNEDPALDTDQWFTAWKISLADGNL